MNGSRDPSRALEIQEKVRQSKAIEPLEPGGAVSTTLPPGLQETTPQSGGVRNALRL
jgi:hypothetical protein